MHLCRHLASKLELRLGDARLIVIVLLIAAWLPGCAAACGARQVVHIWRWCLDLGFYIDFLFAGLVAGVVYPSCAGWWWWDEEVGVTVQSTAAVVLSPGPPPRSPPPAAPRITSHGDGLPATNIWIFHAERINAWTLWHIFISNKS